MSKNEFLFRKYVILVLDTNIVAIHCFYGNNNSNSINLSNVRSEWFDYFNIIFYIAGSDKILL